MNASLIQTQAKSIFSLLISSQILSVLVEVFWYRFKFAGFEHGGALFNLYVVVSWEKLLMLFQHLVGEQQRFKKIVEQASTCSPFPFLPISW